MVLFITFTSLLSIDLVFSLENGDRKCFETMPAYDKIRYLCIVKTELHNVVDARAPSSSILTQDKRCQDICS